ncbi:MAG: histidinol-phosphate aminotransferase family protein, partial [Clostridia bacterium]|nr:histidinol-phosphate aminotransferase family protein [Clostridia bacterium]
ALNVVLRSIKARCATSITPCATACRDICRMNNCDVLSHILQERKNFKFDSDEFIEKIGARTDTVILSNPNNATGRIIPKSDIITILDYCLSKGIYVIIDETYMEFVPDGQSSINLINQYYNLIVIRSLSEYYNLSGIGAAYVVSCTEIIDNIKGNQVPWQVDVYGSTLCENAYKDEKFDLKTKKWIFEEKRKFVNKLKTLNNVRVINSDCHFILLKLEDISATNVYNRLLKSNILIRDASGFTGLDGSYIRIAVKDEKSNEQFLQALLKYLI